VHATEDVEGELKRHDAKYPEEVEVRENKPGGSDSKHRDRVPEKSKASASGDIANVPKDAIDADSEEFGKTKTIEKRKL
jgi:hypothetical protein